MCYAWKSNFLSPEVKIRSYFIYFHTDTIFVSLSNEKIGEQNIIIAEIEFLSFTILHYAQGEI